MKTVSKSYWKNPTIANARMLKKAQYQLAGIYLKEQTEFIQNKIDKIRDSVEDRQSRMHPPFPKKSDLGLVKNYRGITLTSIAAKI